MDDGSPVARLRKAIAQFRREQGVSYLLGEQDPASRPAPRARDWLASGAADRLWDELAGSGAPEVLRGALAVHVVRARAEQVYAPARQSAQRWLASNLAVEGAVQPVAQVLQQWLRSRHPAERGPLLKAVSRSVEGLLPELSERRAEAYGAAREAIGRLAPPRHPDAGPEQGAGPLCARWLDLTEGVAKEAFAFVRREAGVGASGDGGELLWALYGHAWEGLFRPEQRLRRLASDWAPLGLALPLERQGRADRPHSAPFPAAHVVPLDPPRDVRMRPAPLTPGLAAEWGQADGVGRTLALCLVAPALPVELRYPAVGSVSRAFGALGVARFREAAFLRRQRGLDAATASKLGRWVAAWCVADSRVHAAQVLCRDQTDAPEWMSRALGSEVSHGVAGLLALRLSPGGPARAKIHAPALCWALREQFDEDWFRNPRAAEPLRGAAARGGDLSVEQWCHELGAEVAQGAEWLAEVF